jgi:hypothetical protein
MWADTHYIDRWLPKRGYNQTYVLMDQMAGLFLGAVPSDRAASVASAVLASEGACGIRETFPYIVYAGDSCSFRCQHH